MTIEAMEMLTAGDIAKQLARKAVAEAGSFASKIEQILDKKKDEYIQEALERAEAFFREKMEEVEARIDVKLKQIEARVEHIRREEAKRRVKEMVFFLAAAAFFGLFFSIGHWVIKKWMGI